MSKPIVGVLVGGAAKRMGGVAKGTLSTHADGIGEPIVARLLRMARACDAEVILVGDVEAYDGYGAQRIGDARAAAERDPDGREGGSLEERAGPLAGLVALLETAHGRDAIALACDLPRLHRTVLERLLTAEGTTAPRIDGIWQPVVARYAATTLPLATRRLREGRRSLRALLDEAKATPLALTDEEAASLIDWDTPEDVSRAPSK